MRSWLELAQTSRLRAGRAASSTSPRLRGEVDLRAPLARSKSGEGAIPQARTRGEAPSPGFHRAASGARNPTSPRKRGEVARVALLAITLTLQLTANAASAADILSISVDNASEPTLCAETDNVYLKLASPQVRRFIVEAVHPAYMGTIVVDRYAADFRNCDMGGDPAFKATPRRVTLFETNEWQLVGHTFGSYWRPNSVPVRVGDRVENGLHLLQLWTSFQERAEEVLVLYPPDGYWRARPLPPAHLRWSAYGSSFLVGPIETQGRPLVDIKEIAFDPATRTFRLAFTRGGAATLRLDALDQERIALDVTLEQPVSAAPFAALRSMFVTEVNNDVAHIGWRGKDAKAWQQQPVMTFKQADAVELWAGRTIPSRHNTSAPDMGFRDFQ
jgi:hypothetical protein